MRFQPKQYLLFLLSIVLFSCDNKRPLIPKDLSEETERKNKLIVFVGEKIEVTRLPQEEESWDAKFKARYKILQRVYGDYMPDTVEFIVYDHYGDPVFSNYKNALLFVREYGGRYYHERYQFYDVYKTKDNRWAGRYSVRDLGYDNKRDKNVVGERIDFAEEVSIPLSKVNGKEVGCWFPAPYYKIENDKAIAVYGNYIEDLFKIKKEGVLRSRGLFGDGKPGEVEVVDTQMAEIVQTPQKEWKKFSIFWNQLISLKDSFNIRDPGIFVLDTIKINGALYPGSKYPLKNILTQKLLYSFKDSADLDFGIMYDIYEQNGETKQELKKLKTSGLFQATTMPDTINTVQSTITLSFVNTKSGFKLYGVKETKRSICWQ